MSNNRSLIYLSGLLLMVGTTMVACASGDVLSPPITDAAQSSSQTAQSGERAEPTVDSTLYRSAMRAGFEGEVDAFVNGTRYLLDVDITPAPHSVTGHQRVDYVNLTGNTLEEVVFRLYPNSLLGSRELVVENILVDGTPVRAARRDELSTLSVPLPTSLAPDNQIVIEMDFALDITSESVRDTYGRLGHLENVLSLPSFFPLLSVYDAQSNSWWREIPSLQGDPVFSESAVFEVYLTAPTQAVVATVGQTLSQTDNGDGTTNYHIVTGPVRDFAIYMSDDYQVLSLEDNGVTVNVFSLPGNEESDEFALQATSNALDLFSRLYGAYPFAEVDVVETATLAGGIEYPGLYVIASDVWDKDNPFFEIVIAHEMAHQWWYSVVGNDQVGQPWLDEGLAQYSTTVYMDNIHGEDSGNGMLASFSEAVTDYIDDGGPDLPVGLPVDSYSREEYGLFVYRKAPLFLATLEATYGEQAMQNWLHAYFDEYKYGIATRDDIQRLAEQMLGDKEVSRLFDEWIGPQN